MVAAEKTPLWCPRVHTEEQRPRYASGIVNPYVCCDVQMQTGARLPEKCEPVCPWQSGTPWVQAVWGFLVMCIAPPSGEKDTTYRLDRDGFEFAAKLYGLPHAEWMGAFEWCAFVLHGLNTPETES